MLNIIRKKKESKSRREKDYRRLRSDISNEKEMQKREKNGKGRLNKRDKYRKQVVKRWVREIRQNIFTKYQWVAPRSTHPSKVDKMSTRNFWELSGKR